MSGLLCRVIEVNVDHHVQTRITHIGTQIFIRGKGEDMSISRQLRNFWIPGVATIVLGSFSNAFAQQSYRLTDLGNNKNTNNFAMVMGLNNLGWAENMDGIVNPPETSTATTIASGRAVIGIYGFNIDLGTLGKPDANSWTDYGGINDLGEAVGLSETAMPDPNGEDICGFGTHLQCLPFLWRDGHMSALPTLGGINGWANAINNREQIVGFAEDGALDPTCGETVKNNRITLPAFWERGNVKALPLAVRTDVDGFANGINEQGHAVGYSGNCNVAHAVVWKDKTVFPLKDYGVFSSAYAINNSGQVVGQIGSAAGYFAAVWPQGADGEVKSIKLLPGDAAAFATGINNRGQVVGSTFDSNGDWSHGFIWQDDVITDLNTVIPDDSNLLIIAASNINELGQISGMATVQNGPRKGEIHAILLTPADISIGASMADYARTHPHSALPANACNHSSQRFGPARLQR
jgi:probable HAF family extracellular repeat protein